MNLLKVLFPIPDEDKALMNIVNFVLDVVFICFACIVWFDTLSIEPLIVVTLLYLVLERSVVLLGSIISLVYHSFRDIREKL